MTVLTNKGGFEVNFFSILAAVGLIAIAGAVGVLLGLLEEKLTEDDNK